MTSADPSVSRNATLPPSAAHARIERVLAFGWCFVAAFILYTWLARIGDDLQWDEAYNLRVYVRSPLTAATLYREPNNHPLESVLKSLFHALPGLDAPPFHHFVGYLIVLAFAAVAVAWRRAFAASGAHLAAAFALCACLLPRAINAHALELRGYFLSLMLQLTYGLALLKRSGMLTDARDGEAERPALGRRDRLVFAGISAALLYTIPLNVVVLPPLWLATGIMFRGGGSRPIRASLAASAKIAVMSLAVAAVLWLPLIATAVVGGIRNMPPIVPVGAWTAFVDEAKLLLRQFQPLGLADAAYGVVMAAIAAASLLRLRSAAVQAAWVLSLPVLLVVCVTAAFRNFPDRIAAPYVAPVATAAMLIVGELTRRLRPSVQLAASALLLLGALTTLPAIATSQRFLRDDSDLAAFVSSMSRTDERRVLVCYERAEQLRHALSLRFDAGRVCSSFAEYKRRVAVDRPESGPLNWKERARLWIDPPPPEPRIDPEALDCLVLIGPRGAQFGALDWSDPTLERLKSRLSRHATFNVDFRTIDVFERP